MKTENKIKIPGIFARILGVWHRHRMVYSNNLISNGLPPFVDPLIILAGIGVGLGVFIKQMDGVPYLQYLASGLLISTAMMTSSFECTYGTFIRLEFDKVYDGMIAAPMSARNMLLGEILWAGTKGFFFSLAVLSVFAAVGVLRSPQSLLVPLVGFLSGIMFACMALFVTSLVKNIDHFSFYFTGLLNPMFFFCGVFFPISNMPPAIRPLTEILPLTHAVRISRAICFNRWSWQTGIDFAVIALVAVFFGAWAIHRLEKKIID